MSTRPPEADEFTPDEWFIIASHQTPGLTREEFDAKWPQFREWLDELQKLYTRPH